MAIILSLGILLSGTTGNVFIHILLVRADLGRDGGYVLFVIWKFRKKKIKNILSNYLGATALKNGGHGESRR